MDVQLENGRQQCYRPFFIGDQFSAQWALASVGSLASSAGCQIQRTGVQLIGMQLRLRLAY
jgi:hypothetical protein